MHICDIFHLHIEGVLSKRALAGRRNLSGSGQGCRWTMAATLLETVLAALRPTWPLRHELAVSGLHWDHLSITSLFLHYTFSVVHTHLCLHFYTTGRLKQTKSTPDGHLMCWWYRDCVPQWPTTWPFVCVLYPVCTCVSEWLMTSEWVWECVSGTQWYCTIQLPLFANVESYRMNWTVTWSKSYAIFCGQLLNFFIELKKKNFGLPHIQYIILCMHHTETERNHDGHLTFYLLLPGFRIIKILVLISCPMYLFVPPPPILPCTKTRWTSGHLGLWNNQKWEEFQEDSH